jgi:glucan phosphorylase
MEYALPKNLPIYAGGLGVLAGDYVQEAYNQKFPMVAIGLFYSKKCWLNKAGNYCVINDPVALGLKPVVDKFGNKIKAYLPIEGRDVAIQAWLYDEDTIPVYLLDTNFEENDPSDRSITDILYITEPGVRLKQELILGIGGVRMLEALGIKPSIYHMNEGHSAFLVFELAKMIMTEKSIDFRQAFTEAKKQIAFTNHTLVVGGHDLFDRGLVAWVLNSYSVEIGMPIAELLNMGVGKDKKSFSTTDLAFEAASKTNAVSKLHAEAAKQVWPDREMLPVTNGVSIERWDNVRVSADLFDKHAENKRNLLQRIKNETGIKWGEDELIIAWARRLTGYKRPVSLFDDIERAKKLLNTPGRPVRVVFAGYPHYLDEEGNWFLARLRDLSDRDLKGSMVYLERYSTDLSAILTSGADVWLNTPIVGLEACGTSGMKAALNGTLVCSTNDGWLPEVDLGSIGFILDNELSTSLFNTISGQIVPQYYESKAGSGPNWQDKMVKSRSCIMDNFGADRMLLDYIEKSYLPIMNI